MPCSLRDASSDQVVRGALGVSPPRARGLGHKGWTSTLVSPTLWALERGCDTIDESLTRGCVVCGWEALWMLNMLNTRLMLLPWLRSRIPFSEKTFCFG